MAREQDVRRARDGFAASVMEHQRKQGVAVPDSRKAEAHAAEVARRNDRKANEKK